MNIYINTHELRLLLRALSFQGKFIDSEMLKELDVTPEHIDGNAEMQREDLAKLEQKLEKILRQEI